MKKIFVFNVGSLCASKYNINTFMNTYLSALKKWETQLKHL